ncbi:hypothetical protein LCGC14_0637450 [marine sediment metagenome]|uniref:Uncharacterized protein n=1 Tax=marine sediment metagenome TaxID=412755 RepID=A0A0F9R5D5_9ZZZZ
MTNKDSLCTCGHAENEHTLGLILRACVSPCLCHDFHKVEHEPALEVDEDGLLTKKQAGRVMIDLELDGYTFEDSIKPLLVDQARLSVAQSEATCQKRIEGIWATDERIVAEAVKAERARVLAGVREVVDGAMTDCPYQSSRGLVANLALDVAWERAQRKLSEVILAKLAELKAKLDDPDEGLALKPEVESTLHQSLNKPPESFLTTDEMRKNLEAKHD